MALRIRTRLALLALLLFPLLTARPLRAQTTEADIRTRLALQPLYLRGSWGDDALRFDKYGQPAESYEKAPFSLAGVNVTKVHLGDKRLFLAGKRVGLIFGSTGAITRIALTRKDKLQIEIDAPPDGNFGPVLDAIFTKDLAEIPAACDGPWRSYGISRWLPAGAGPPTAIPDEHAMKVGGSVKAPRLLHSVDPKFSPSARELKHSGSVRIGLLVPVDGSPTDLRIIRPTGLGLDEQALAAVSMYRFAPATQNGTPVPVELYVDVSFQIF